MKIAKSVRRSALLGCALLAAFFAFPYLTPKLLGWYQPEIVFQGDASRKVVYLTIDDSPTGATDQILAVLAKHRVPATFFIIAGRVESKAELEKITSAGHQLGHHMRTTTACSTLDWATFEADFRATDIMLNQSGRVALFRPPSDFGTKRQLAYAKSKGYTPILGTVFPLDHWIKQKQFLSYLCQWLTVPGGILILHDGIERGPTTAAVLDTLIPRLREEGYQFGDLPSLATASSNP